MVKCESVARHLALCDECFKELQQFFNALSGKNAGSVKSVKKAKSSRENGKLGGRPKK